MLGLLKNQIDAGEFMVGELLGKSLEEVRAMSYAEVEEWKGYIHAKAQQQELDAKKPQRRGRGR